MNGKFWQELALTAVCVLTTTAAEGAILTAVPPMADAHVRSGADKKNFGSEVQLELKTTVFGGTSEAYFLFPLPQHTPYAEKIVLRLSAQLSDPGTGQVLVRSLADTNWNERELTWRTRPAHKDTIGTLKVVGLSGAWCELDVTAYAKAEAAEGKSTLALALVPGDDSRNLITIPSRENPTRPPTLIFSRSPISTRISFCPAKTTPPEGSIPDNGEVFGNRGNGFIYGWSVDNAEFMRDRAESKYKKDKPVKTPDRRYDFLAYMDNEKMKSPVSWDMGVPNGIYNVRVVAGDSTKYDSIFGISVEGVTAIDGVPDAQRRWLESTVRVNVMDGRLTIANTPGSSNNKLSFIEVSEMESLISQIK